MVWPILISVAVTPRISAAADGAVRNENVRNETAPSAPIAAVKRIDFPSLFVVVPRALKGATVPLSGWTGG